jgi:large subunit ribosomal protein L9
MKIIFIKDSEHGKTNQVKDVADGLAKNLLIKKGFAIPATQENMAALKRKQDKEQETLKEFEKNTNALIEIIQDKVLTIRRDAPTKVKIQGSISAEDICKELKTQLNLSIDKKLIKAEKINLFGMNEALIDFGHGKKATLRIHLFRNNN